MTFDEIVDLIAAVLLLAGGVLSLAAGIGLLRFGEPLARLHAATKPQVLGLLLVLIALAITAGSWPVVLMVLPIAVFQMLTAPVAAHMVGRAAYRTGNIDDAALVVDELRPAVEEATQRAEP